MEVKYKNEAFLVVGEYVCPCDVPTGIFTLYLRFVKLCRENKSELFVLWLINDRFTEDDLRSKIFGTIVVKFIACLSLLGFSNIQKWYNCPFLTDYYPLKGHLEFSGAFLWLKFSKR